MNRRQTRSSKAAGRRKMKRGWSAFRSPTSEEWAKSSAIPPGLVRVWVNNVYIVQLYWHDTEWGFVEHLLVRRNDGGPVRSWADLQRIKNELAGEDRVAVEVFPARGDLVDQANCYHLWILPEGFALPFGLHIDQARRGR